ncbi:acetoacetate decarboxylase family protein, partial [Croceicoccus pelagius]
PSRRSPTPGSTGLVLRRPMADFYSAVDTAIRNQESLIITYETDEDAALALLPEADELRLADPFTAKVVFVKMPATPWGAYNEAYQLIDCTWDGKPCIYPVRLLVDGDVGLMIGRELWGNPKKFGTIEFYRESSLLQCTGERPRGNRIVTAIMHPDTPIEVPTVNMDVLGFRVIPNPEDPSTFSLAELLINTLRVTTTAAWAGQGSLLFNDPSDLDPWYKLPVRKVISSVFTVSDVDTGERAKIVKRY